MARGSWTRRRVGFVVGVGVVGVAFLLGALAFTSSRDSHRTATTQPTPPSTPTTAGHAGIYGIKKIRHVVVIMQENRSFDSYFGTYPGADGIPMQDGVPTVCAPDPVLKACVKPSADHADVNVGGPHAAGSARHDINNGPMLGFVQETRNAQHACANVNNPNCALLSSQGALTDVMGYHTQSDIPNYWAYAKNFVLQDRMFQPNASWSLPEHLFLTSEWSALCTSSDPSTCANALQSPGLPPDFNKPKPQRPPPVYSWTDLTYLLHKNNVSWAYYVFAGTEADTQDAEEMATPKAKQNAATPGIWNPLAFFTTVQTDNELGNIRDLADFFAAARTGTLPAVSWIAPNGRFSEHPPALVSDGH